MIPDYEQLSLFQGSEIDIERNEKTRDDSESAQPTAKVSIKTLEGFGVVSIPFWGCDFDAVYPMLAKILPREKIVFADFSFSTAVICEIICSAICHQMNWDFLREAVRNKTDTNIGWLSPNYLSQIAEEEVFEMLANYPKPERIRKEERTKILHDVGNWLKKFDPVESAFLNKNRDLLDCTEVRNNLLSCDAFSNDPEEKKLQLLLQKLSAFSELSGLAKYYQPAIDYHLVRCYLRRGLLVANTKYAKDFLYNSNVERKESTMAGIRHLCSEILLNICDYTGLDTNIVNQIEWNIGRSVCVRDDPDCFLKSEDAKWLKDKFNVCPFIASCAARNNDNLLHLNEPIYKGSSY